MTAIKQRKGLQTRSYTLNPNSDFLEVEYITSRDKLKYNIHLTEVGNEIQYEADNLTAGKIVFAITTSLALICLGVYFFGGAEGNNTFAVLAFLCGLLSLIGYLKPNKDDILITNGNKTIRLFRNKPNEESVLKFANDLIKNANEKKKELLINFDLSEEQFMANLQWLVNMRLINSSESEEFKSTFKLKKLI